ncbi:LicD family-domain-containing protein [Hypoxylon sp. FL1150]|nr:LicD family-domain-containing protein [Hypoxylon sp. FL1150]
MYFRFLLLLLYITTSSAAVLPDKPLGHYHRRQHAAAGSSSNNNRKHAAVLQYGEAKKQKQKQQSEEKKYFHEAGGTLELTHYDARYFRGPVSYAEHVPELRRLVQSWLAAAGELRVDAWLAHGTLLGWWWNGRVMPWDYDLDVQMPAATVAYLGRHFNRTLHDYVFVAGDEGLPLVPGLLREQGGGYGSNGSVYNISSGEAAAQTFVNKTYLLDINPFHGAVGRGNGANIIDARWIDTSTGLFVDITGLAEREAAEKPGVWSCKNAHRYRTMELYPLRRTEFEGMPAAVPFAFDKILTEEYGARSLTATQWAGHHWVPESKEWVKNPSKKNETKANDQVIVVVEKTVVKGVE